MSKGWRIFFKVLYYVLTFSLGTFIAIVLPTVNRDIVTYEFFDKFIEEKEYVKAIDLLGGLYNTEAVYRVDGENEVIIFETASRVQKEEIIDEEKVKIDTFNASYVCIIRGLNREWFENDDEEKNQSKIFLDDKPVEILQTDLDGDGKNDTIATLIDSDYICFSIDEILYSEVNTIELIKADGNSLLKLTDLNLNFTSSFHLEVEEFIKQYNLLSEDGEFSVEDDAKLLEEYLRINKANTNYQRSGTYSEDKIKNEANKDSIIFVLVYFICIYILGDCLVGQRYIFQFFRFLYRKIKNKIKPEVENEPLALGNNFYCSVTFEATVCDGFDKDIIISYEHTSNKVYNFKTIITKSTEYKKVERIHGGVYKLTNVECPNYTISNLPLEVDIKGYRKEIKFIVNKENEKMEEKI